MINDLINNWLELGVFVFLVLMMIVGWRRGIVKSILLFVSSIFSVILGLLLLGPLRHLLPFFTELPEKVGSGATLAFSFIGLMIALRLVFTAIGQIAKLPVIRGFDKVAGLLFWGCLGLAFVWVFFLIIPVFTKAQWAKDCTEMVASSPFLTWLSEQNLFLKLLK